MKNRCWHLTKARSAASVHGTAVLETLVEAGFEDKPIALLQSARDDTLMILSAIDEAIKAESMTIEHYGGNK